MRILSGIVILTILVAPHLWAPPATAARSPLVEVTVGGLPETGPIGEVTFELQVQPLLKDKNFRVLLAPQGRLANRLLTKLSDAETAASARIASGARTPMPVSITVSSAPKQTVTVVLTIADRNNTVIGHHPVELYFAVENGRYRRTTYEDLYIPKKRALSPDQAEEIIPIAKKRLPPGATIASLPGAKMRLGASALPKLKSRQLPDPGGINGKAAPAKRTDWQVPGVLDGFARSLARPNRLLELVSPVQKAEAQAGYLVTGSFFYIGLDNAWHGAWNWRVRLLWHKPDGTVQRLGSAWILEDGTWQVGINTPGYTGQNLIVHMQVGGGYLVATNTFGKPIVFSLDVDENIFAQGPHYDYGQWTINLSEQGEDAMLPGLGEIMTNAQLVWYHFYNRGLNPDRAKSMRLFFPNTAAKPCGLDFPWSCAYPDGSIYLLSEDAKDPFVIMHELAHQLQFQFWDNQSAPGGGQWHQMNECTNTGTALEEGFADAVAYWVMFEESGGLPFWLESPDADVCRGDTNEIWVAATFWDLFDKQNTGSDEVTFNNGVDVFSVFLRNGVKPRMGSYRNFYRNETAKGYKHLIDAIFTENGIPF